MTRKALEKFDPATSKKGVLNECVNDLGSA